MGKLIDDRMLRSAIQHHRNVLLRGKHGVGKTHIIISLCKELGLTYAYFSASTMDPWVDFIGVPREHKDEKTGISYLELVKPRGFQFDEYDVIILDEYNRAPKKVKNALMELIQFRSINGRKYDRIKSIFAMVNPDDDTDLKYDVEPMDPAQLDRFHHIVDVKFDLDPDYLTSKFGPEISAFAQSWWNNLDAKTHRLKVSPRRLDYALEIYTTCQEDGMNEVETLNLLKSALPVEVNPKSLVDDIHVGSFKSRRERVMESGTEDEKREFFHNQNHLELFENLILNITQPGGGNYEMFKNPDKIIYESIPYMPLEKISSWMDNAGPNKRGYKKVIDQVTNHTHPVIVGLREDREKVSKAIENADRLMTPDYDAIKRLTELNIKSPTPHIKYVKQGNVPAIPGVGSLTTTPDRQRFYDIMTEKMPARMCGPTGLYGKNTVTIIDNLLSIAESSQATTLDTKMPLLGGMILHVALDLHKNGFDQPTTDGGLDQKMRERWGYTIPQIWGK